MGLSKIWLFLKHCLSYSLYSHSAALLHYTHLCFTEVLRGWGKLPTLLSV